MLISVLMAGLMPKATVAVNNVTEVVVVKSNNEIKMFIERCSAEEDTLQYCYPEASLEYQKFEIHDYQSLKQRLAIAELPEESLQELYNQDYAIISSRALQAQELVIKLSKLTVVLTAQEQMNQNIFESVKNSSLILISLLLITLIIVSIYAVRVSHKNRLLQDQRELD